MRGPDVSVVTVTFGRLGILLEKLASLCHQTLPAHRFELLLCVNADPATARALERLRTPFPIEVLELPERQGAARARNLLAERARAPLLYFSDDDALLMPDTLERHLGRHRAAGRDAALVGGVDWEHGGRIEPMRPARIRYWNLHGINTSLSARAFERAGGFPEWLDGYGFEDVLLGYRLERSGVPILALPDAPVRHVGPNPMLGLEPAKARSAGRNAVRVAERHPELAFRLGVHPVSLGLKRLALAEPLGAIWRSFGEGSYRYERAFLEGALEEQHARRPV